MPRRPRRPWSPWILDPLDVAAAVRAAAVADPPPARPASGCLFTLLAMVALLAAIGVAAWAGAGAFLFDSVILRALPMAALLGLAAKPLLDRAPLPHRGERMFATGLALAFLGAVVGAATAMLLDHPLVHASECSFWIGYDNPGAMTLPVGVALVAGGGAAAAMLAGTIVTGALAPARRRWALPVAWGATVAAAALVLVSAAARWRRPNPSLGAYVASLPEIGRVLPQLDHVPDAGEAELPAGAVRWAWTTIDAPEPVLSAEVAGMWMLELPGRVEMGRIGGPAPTQEAVGRRGATFYVADTPISIRRDAARGLVILEREDARGHAVHDDIAGRAAFREPGLEAVDVRIDDLHDLSGPPASWIAAACAGLAIALLALWPRRGSPLSREADHLAGRADGPDGHAWIELDDGSPRVPVPEGEAVPPGPVVVIPLGASRGRGATYREAGGIGPVLVVPGTVAALRAAVDAATANRAMLAIAAIALTAAPLAAACWHGLG